MQDKQRAKIIYGDIFALSESKKYDAIIIPAPPRKGTLSELATSIYERADTEKMAEERRAMGHLPCGKTAVSNVYYDTNKIRLIYISVPSWKYGTDGELDKLAKCYESALRCAKDIGMKNVIMPLLGSGRNGFPEDIAKNIAENALKSFVEKAGDDFNAVVVIFSDTPCDPIDEIENKKAYYGEKYFKETVTLANRACLSTCAITGLRHNTYKNKPHRSTLIQASVAAKMPGDVRIDFLRCYGVTNFPKDSTEEEIQKLACSGISDWSIMLNELDRLGHSIDKHGKER